MRKEQKRKNKKFLQGKMAAPTEAACQLGSFWALKLQIWAHSALQSAIQVRQKGHARVLAPPPPSSLLPRPLEITEYRNTGSPYTLSALHTLSLSIPQTLLARLLARRTLDCLCTALLTWCVGTVGHQPYLYYFIDISLLLSQAFSPWYWIRKMYFKMKYDLVNRTQSRTTWSAVSILVNLVTISDSIAYFSLLESILPCKISTNLLWFIHIEWADHKKLGSHQKEGRSYQSVTQNAAKKGLVSITTQSRRGRKPDGIKP